MKDRTTWVRMYGDSLILDMSLYPDQEVSAPHNNNLRLVGYDYIGFYVAGILVGLVFFNSDGDLVLHPTCHCGRRNSNIPIEDPSVVKGFEMTTSSKLLQGGGSEEIHLKEMARSYDSADGGLASIQPIQSKNFGKVITCNVSALLFCSGVSRQEVLAVTNYGLKKEWVVKQFSDTAFGGSVSVMFDEKTKEFVSAEFVREPSKEHVVTDVAPDGTVWGTKDIERKFPEDIEKIFVVKKIES